MSNEITARTDDAGNSLNGLSGVDENHLQFSPRAAPPFVLRAVGYNYDRAVFLQEETGGAPIGVWTVVTNGRFAI